MRSDPVSPGQVLRALELFGPQARPYNFDDCFDCWGLVRAVFDWLDDGYEVNDELGEAGDGREARWRPIAGPGDLVPGDLLTAHPHADPDFHTGFYCGRVGGDELVYDSSPRGLVPLYDESFVRVDDRRIYTRYMRVTVTTDRLRDGGGAYLRLWDDRQRYVNRAFHARLLAGGAAWQRDLVALRRGAGLSAMPFYCTRRLPRDTRGRELYDNLAARHLDYYLPDGAPLPDDDYLAAASGGLLGAGVRARPQTPILTSAPPWISRHLPLTVAWRFGEDACGAGSSGGAPRTSSTPTGCRIEVWEETWDLWRHRLLREDHDVPRTRFSVPSELLHRDSRFAVVISARGREGYSAGTVAPFLFRPAPGNPLLAYNPVRPTAVSPDAAELVPAGRDVVLRWQIPQPRRNQIQARVDVYEDGTPGSGAPLVFSAELGGVAAAASRCTVSAASWLRPGFLYRWYVTPVNDRGLAAHAPAEGVFLGDEEG